MQEELGYNALAAGIALVPFSLVLAVTGVISGRLTKRFELATLLIVSCAFMAVGLAVLSFVPASYGYAGMVLPFLFIAARRRQREHRELLALHAMAARGEGKDIKKALRDDG